MTVYRQMPPYVTTHQVSHLAEFVNFKTIQGVINFFIYFIVAIIYICIIVYYSCNLYHCSIHPYHCREHPRYSNLIICYPSHSLELLYYSCLPLHLASKIYKQDLIWLISGPSDLPVLQLIRSCLFCLLYTSRCV